MMFCLFMSNLHNRSKSAKVQSSNLGTFRLKIKQFWQFEEISIFSNGGHLGWRVGLSDIILKGIHPGTIPAGLGFIWFSGFRGEDSNVIFIKICLICIIGINRLKEKFHTKSPNIC